MTTARTGRTLLSFTSLLALSCGSGGQTGDELAENEVTAEIRGKAQRLVVSGTDVGSAARDNQDFAWRMFALQSTPAENTVFSPYSISVAAAMLSAGAGGETLIEMQQALGFSTEGDAFHVSHNRLLQALDSRNHEATPATDTRASLNAQSLRVSNDIWVMPHLRPREEFLNTLSANYGAGVNLTRFDTQPEASRVAVNAKVANDTEQLIDELLPQGSVSSDTVMVLTNAVYFKANWRESFSESATREEPFETAAGASVSTLFMHNGSLSIPFAVTDDYTAASLPYSGDDLELVAIMPTAGSFESFVDELTGTRVDSIVSDLQRGQADLAFPKFEIASSLPLKEQLVSLGMVQAFSTNANFDRMFPSPYAGNVYIESAFHDATIVLDEKGTEAAAATAFVASVVSEPPPGTPLVFDHPFVFLVRDIATDATLFVGQYVVPD